MAQAALVHSLTIPCPADTLDELWSLLNFVNPQIFDDLSVFQSWFGFKDIGQKDRGGTDEQSIVVEQQKNQTVTKLHEILRPFLLRRIKKDVLKEMPPKREVIVYSGVSKLQAGYGDLIDKGTLRGTLLGQGIEQGRNLSQTNKMMNHRKNINHPFLFGEPIDPSTGVHLGTSHPQLLVRASGKFALLDRMLTRLHTDGHQVLVFSQMTAVLNILEDYMLFRKWNYCRIDGSTKIDDRQKQMDIFNAEKTNGMDGKRNEADDRFFVFMLSTRAGGLGINLVSFVQNHCNVISGLYLRCKLTDVCAFLSFVRLVRTHALSLIGKKFWFAITNEAVLAY